MDFLCPVGTYQLMNISVGDIHQFAVDVMETHVEVALNEVNTPHVQ
jgi:hypothetical protein